MSNFSNDTFTESGSLLINLLSHTPEIGGWAAGSISAGNWTLDSSIDRAYTEGTSTCIIYGTTNAAGDGESVLGTFQVLSNPSLEFGAGIRAVSGSNTGYFVLYISGQWRLYRYVSGAFTVLASATVAAPSVGSHTISLSATGTGSSVVLATLIDGVAPFTDYTDTDAARITSLGSVAMYSGGFANTVSAGWHMNSIVGANPSTGVDLSPGVGAMTFVGYAPTVTYTGSSASGTIITAPLKNNTGQLQASKTGITVNVRHPTTDALIVQKTGQTTNSSGVLTVTDPLIAAGTSYALEPKLADGSRLLPVYTAS